MELISFGGKADRLIHLRNLGYNVPNFFVVDSVDAAPELIKEKITDLQGEHFAVRSSANVEDSANQSFAGMFSTFLFVKKADVPQKVTQVFNDIAHPRLQQYLNTIDGTEALEMNVIVQEMIGADVSGVAFGKNVTDTEQEGVVISSAYGLGKAIVDGQINTDSYTGLPSNWEKIIADKNEQLVYRKELLTIPVEEGLRFKDSLSIHQLNEIYQLLNKLEKEFGKPQDIEFCYKNNILYLLQSRDITTLDRKLIVWDNSNIVESYPGITSPFTFSFIKDIYATAYRNFALLLGVSKSQVDANYPVFQEMLGHIKGRVYYHLINWYKALSLLPGYKINAAFMEKMMGVDEPLGIEVNAAQPSSKLKAYFQLVNSVRQLIVTNKKLPELKKNFTDLVQNTFGQYRDKDYFDTSLDDIWSDYIEFKNLLVNQWQPPLANDLFAMIYYGSLDKFCSKNFGDSNLHTKLIVGRHEVISAQPALLIEEIIKTASEENWLESIQNENVEDIWELCQRNELGKTGKLIVKYIEEFGDRTVGELKLENDTFRQNPSSFIKILSSYRSVSNSYLNDLKKESIELEKKLAGQLPFYKKWWFSYLVKKAAETVSDRENLRLERTKAFGIIRKIINALGQKLYQEQIILKPKDVFFLNEAELDDYIISKSSDLSAIIKQRKLEFSEYETYKNLPNRIKQKGKIKESDLQNLKPVTVGDLEGIACSEGVVRGKVRIMEKPDEVKSLEGDILVTQSTDPGWITIFTSAGGILVERGSALSHASIVSRELGIPCIVAIKGITQKLKTGDLIEMDGKTGKIKIIE